MDLLEALWPHLIKQESGGNPNAVSPKGAFGLAQLMPGTSRDPGFGVKPFDPSVPGDNERMGKDYRRAMLARYGNDPKRALAAYNWGHGNADKWNGDPSSLPGETRGYITNILSRAGLGGGGKAQPMSLGSAGVTPPSNNVGAAPAPSGNAGMDKSLLGNLLNQGGAGGLLGGSGKKNLGPLLMSLGAGIASGSTEGWGPGIGKGLALAQQSQQNQRDNSLEEKLLGLKMAEAGVPGAREALGIPAPEFGIPDIKDRAATEAGMRKEFTSLSGDFIKVRDSYSKIQSAISDPSPAGDMAVIFNYMRLLDPGSTVREGEYATAQNAGSVPDRVRNMYNMVLGGTKLTPTQRTDFTKQAKGLFGAQERQQKKLSDQYRMIAKRLKIDPENIGLDLSIVDQPMPGAEAPQTSTRGKGDLGAAPSALPAGVTEEDIAHTMQIHGMTREQVLERLRQDAP
jgi:hypothetical protein